MALRIASPGPKMAGGTLFLTAVLGLVTHSVTLILSGIALAGFTLFFFRDPERFSPEDPDVAYAPGDGTVLSVEQEGPGNILTLRIFLSVFNVHVQRFPLHGRVVKIHYQKGRFGIASMSQARLNERNVITMETPGGMAIIEQIAGFVARRISWYVGKGEKVRQGQRLGIIYFGSQVALHLPKEWEFTVHPKDKVIGGVTVVARRTPSASLKNVAPMEGSA